MASLFITFEGGEGAGKTTQIRLLKTYLEESQHTVLATREPGGTKKAEKIRQVILSGAIKHMGAYSEALMFFIARLDHVDRLIRPALENNIVVLCDRFSDSTYVYQGLTNGFDLSELRELQDLIVGYIEPDITFILDIPAEIGLIRAQNRSPQDCVEIDRFESEDISFHHKLRQGFLNIAEQYPQRCIVLDATFTQEELFNQIKFHVEQKLK